MHKSFYSDVLDSLVSRLDYIRLSPKKIINLGLYPNIVHTALQQKFPSAEIIDVDNFQSLTVLPSESIEFIFSHFSFSMAPHPKKILEECHRLLSIEGLLLFVDFGPDAFSQWRACFPENRLPTFFDMHHVGDWMKNLHFSDPVMDRDVVTVAYKSSQMIMLDWPFLQDTFPCAIDSYEEYKHDDYYPLTLELIYGHGWKVAVLPDSDEFYISVDAIQRR